MCVCMYVCVCVCVAMAILWPYSQFGPVLKTTGCFFCNGSVQHNNLHETFACLFQNGLPGKQI